MNNVERANSLTNDAVRLLGNAEPQDLPIEILERAGELLEDAFKALPDNPRSMYNVGNIRDELSLARAGPFVSMEMYMRSLEFRVTPDVLLNIGRILSIQDCKYEYALSCFERAVIQQGLYRGAYGMGVCMLMQACVTGEPDMWRRGWYWFEHRRGKAEIKGHPGLWRGDDLRGKRLLIVMETGLGDQIWALRWVKVAKDWGATTILICGPETKRLLEEQSYVDEVHLENDAAPIEMDYITHVMSMQTYMDPSSSDRAVAPYLEVGGKRINAARTTLLKGKWRVGVAWRGSTTRGYPAWRNIRFELLCQFLPLDADIEYVSLQKDTQNQWLWPHMDHESIKLCNDLLDTARLIHTLDLVVTIGSAMSMLAPALGVPTWLLNTHNSAWQFGPNNSPVNWFHLKNPIANPVLRFCQREQGDWTPAVWDLAQELRKWRSV